MDSPLWALCPCTWIPPIYAWKRVVHLRTRSMAQRRMLYVVNLPTYALSSCNGL